MHLTPVGSFKDVTFDSRCRLTAGRDPIFGALREVREIVHGRAFCSAWVKSFRANARGGPCVPL
jgi:hypothetical protein